MGPAPVRHLGDEAGLTPQRLAVLELVQGSSSAVTVDDVAEALGLHANTARKHLSALADDGLVTGRPVPSAGRGRPATAYAASPTRSEHDPRVREYAALAAVLAEHVARTSTNPAADAREAGRRWGSALATDAAPARSARAARGRVVELLDELGFDPATDSRAARVRLRRCPLLDVARQHPEVVCEVHLGLVGGVLDELDADSSRLDLQPFAEPGACVLLLS